jgi:hypothetical protein
MMMNTTSVIRATIQAMMRVYTILTLLLSVVFGAALVAVRGQPFTLPGLMALLPVDCPAPCLLRVRVGTDSLAEATPLIEDHEWVRNTVIVKPINDASTTLLYWNWSGQQPSSVQGDWMGYLRTYHGRSTGVRIRTTLRYGDVWLALGGTRLGTIIPASGQANRALSYIAVFPEPSLLVWATVPRNFTRQTLWQTLVEIESANPQAIAYFAGYELPR